MVSSNVLGSLALLVTLSSVEAFAPSFGIRQPVKVRSWVCVALFCRRCMRGFFLILITSVMKAEFSLDLAGL
jgi:hypothetical protein